MATTLLLDHRTEDTERRNQCVKTRFFVGMRGRAMPRNVLQMVMHLLVTLLFACCIAVAAICNAIPPFYLQGEVAQGQPLPHMPMALLTGRYDEAEEEVRKFRTTLAFIVSACQGRSLCNRTMACDGTCFGL